MRSVCLRNYSTHGSRLILICQKNNIIRSSKALNIWGHLYAKVCCSIAGHDHCHTIAELALTSTDVQPQPLQLDLLERTEAVDRTRPTLCLLLLPLINISL